LIPSDSGYKFCVPEENQDLVLLSFRNIALFERSKQKDIMKVWQGLFLMTTLLFAASAEKGEERKLR